MSIGDYLILGILAVAAFLAVRHILRGRTSCSGGCGGCPHSGGCRKNPPQGGFSDSDMNPPTPAAPPPTKEL